MPFSREQLDVILRIFDDARSLVAALKVQRWEVVKWAVTVNIGLAAAAAGFKKSPAAFFLCAAIVAAFGIGLIFYYNLRLTRTRKRLEKIHTFWRENVIDLKATADLDYGGAKGPNYDGQELILFTLIVACRSFPPGQFGSGAEKKGRGLPLAMRQCFVKFLEVWFPANPLERAQSNEQRHEQPIS